MRFLLSALAATGSSLAIYFVLESLERRGLLWPRRLQGLRRWLGLLVGGGIAALVAWTTGDVSLSLEAFAVYAGIDQLLRLDSATRRTSRRARKLVRVYVRITIDIEAGKPK
jgi:hypothetical protein